MGKKEDESLDELNESRKKFLESDYDDEDPNDDGEVKKESTFSDKFGSCSPFFKNIWDKTLGNIDGDWTFLTLLGISMAFISLFVEATIHICLMSQLYLYRDLISKPILKYFGWIAIPCCLMLFSTAFTKLFAPQVAGSGIPELKTTMGGIIMKESFTFRALVTKIIGLTAVLGTGLPIGREGPFVHIASMLAVVLNKFTSNLKGEYVNRTRNIDVLSAGCAVGVASAFSAPVGGVLFSIEVTSFHFAVRNYWRGFYAATVGTVMHRLLAVWYRGDASFIALFKTDITSETPFALQELLGFILLGIASGLLGVAFVWTHRQYVFFKNNNRVMKAISDTSFLLYPFLVALVYTTLTFPLGTGMFIAGQTTIDEQVAHSFVNFTWQKPDPSIREYAIISHWTSPYTGIYVSLVAYLFFAFFSSIVAVSLPVPAGVFIPVFKFGALLGRLFGELMVTIFPEGFSEGMIDTKIIPGAYAIVGAASFAGAATHTVSTAVIAFELTGQISFAIPIMVGVLIANAIAQVLQPSIFDSIIIMRKLPFLPAIPTTSTRAYDIFVEDFMDRDPKIIWHGLTYDELKIILLINKKIMDFPLVDSPNSMILLGSANRYDLIDLLKENIGEKKKIPFFNEWKSKAEILLADELVMESEEIPETEKAEIVNENRDNEINDAAKTSSMPEGVNKEEATSQSPTEAASVRSRLGRKQPIHHSSLPRHSLSSSLDTLTSINQSINIPSINIQYIDAVSLDVLNSDNTPIARSGRRSSKFSVSKVDDYSGSPSENPSSSLRHASPLSSSYGFEAKVQLQDFEKEKQKPESEESEEDHPKVPFHLPSAFHQSIAKTHETIDKEDEGAEGRPKGILKKTQSFVFEPNRPEEVAQDLDVKKNYVTIHEDIAQFKGMKQSLAVFLKAKSILLMESRTDPIKFTGISRADIPTSRLIEKIKEMELEWEEEQMKKKVMFSQCQINPAPHQLVERTNLLQVHSIFSLLGLSQSYVTAIGRLIGVVTLNELRIAIDKMNTGEFKPQPVKDEFKNKRKFSFGFLSSK